MKPRTIAVPAAVLAAAGLTLATTTAHAAPARYAPPSAVTVPSVTTATATVSWAVPAADKGAHWEVLAYSANNPLRAAYTHARGITGSSAVIKGLPAGTAVDVKVTASGDSSHAASGWTAPVLFFTTASAAAPGPQGPAGPKGDTGPAGKDGTVGDVLHNSSAAVTIAAGGEAQAYATCAFDPDHGLAPNGTADGYVAVGGGWSTDNGSGTSGGKVTVSMSRDELTNTHGRGWLVTAYNNDTVPHTVSAWVICVSAAGDNPAT